MRSVPAPTTVHSGAQTMVTPFVSAPKTARSQFIETRDLKKNIPSKNSFFKGTHKTFDRNQVASQSDRALLDGVTAGARLCAHDKV